MFTKENIKIDRLHQNHFLQYAFNDETVTFYYLDEHPRYEELIKKNLLYRINRENGYDVLIEKEYYEKVKPLFNEECMRAEYEFNKVYLKTKDPVYIKKKAGLAFLISLIFPIILLVSILIFTPDKLSMLTYILAAVMVPLMSMSILKFIVIKPLHKANRKMDKDIMLELGENLIEKLTIIDKKYTASHPLLNSELGTDESDSVDVDNEVQEDK